MGAVVKRQFAIAAALLREHYREFFILTAILFAAAPLGVVSMEVAQSIYEGKNP